MVELAILIVLSLKNGDKAKEKGNSYVLYAGMTALICFTLKFIGASIGNTISEDKLIVRLIAMLGVIIGGVIASIMVKNMKPKRNHSTERMQYSPDEPDAIWECPSCDYENINKDFECKNCGYKVL